jgi:hypothetical protein
MYVRGRKAARGRECVICVLHVRLYTHPTESGAMLCSDHTPHATTGFDFGDDTTSAQASLFGAQASLFPAQALFTVPGIEAFQFDFAFMKDTAKLREEGTRARVCVCVFLCVCVCVSVCVCLCVRELSYHIAHMYTR